VWSWDITKLLGPAKWTYYYLYVIIDIYSRYTPGWMLATVERAHLAERLLADTITAQGVERDQLTIHADRGASMASKPVALLLADLGVTKTHSRPQVPSSPGTVRPESTHTATTAPHRMDQQTRRGHPDPMKL
jgi:putative transposase